MFKKLLVVVALTASLVGCATQDEITLTAYKTLETSAITYDTVMTVASDMHSQGKLQDADWEKLKDAALVYYDAYQVAVFWPIYRLLRGFRPRMPWNAAISRLLSIR